LAAELNRRIASAFAAAGVKAEFAIATPSARPDLADWQSNGALAAAKQLGRVPRQLAEEVAARLASDAGFAKIEVAGPGFINLTLADALLWDAALELLASETQGIALAGAKSRIVLDFGGPNIAKPLHVGHLRSLLIGESLHRILDVLGHSVVTDIHLGDWGLQMGMLISELEHEKGDLTHPLDLEIDEMEAMYIRASAACKADPARLEGARQATSRLQAGDAAYRAVWARMRDLSLASIGGTIAELGARFTHLDGEASVDPLIDPMVAELTERGLAVESEGALVIPLATDTDASPMPPLLLVKRDGAKPYATTDLATIRDRVRRFAPDRILYVVDARQSLHFEQVFRAARRAGLAPGVEFVHIGFGTVNGPDNKPFKTREGGVMRLDDLLDAAIAKAGERVAESEQSRGLGTAEQAALARQIGIAALKYADLSSYRLSGYIFDPERMVSFEGKTGPYLQYAGVRIASILDKAGDEVALLPEQPVLDPEARALLLDCLRLPDIVLGAARDYAPNQIAEHAYTVAQKFSRFYASCPILGETDPARRRSRLQVARTAFAVLQRELWLLGIALPTRM
jgi:arginyl-tRNA synthetase